MTSEFRHPHGDGCDMGSDVLGLVLSQGPEAGGRWSGGGAIGALALTRLISGLLFGVKLVRSADVLRDSFIAGR